MRYKGITIYHTYDHGEWEEENKWHFCTEMESADMDEGSQFDVRSLNTWVHPPHPPFLMGDDDTPKNKKAWKRFHNSGVILKAMKTAIKNAINLGGEAELYVNE